MNGTEKMHCSLDATDENVIKTIQSHVNDSMEKDDKDTKHLSNQNIGIDTSSEASNDESPQKTVHRDENGRVLSAYEIMRFRRIQRNKNYLAGLGLENNSKGSNGKTFLSPFVQKEKQRKKRLKLNLLPEKRHSMSRRKSVKEVNYSSLPRNSTFKNQEIGIDKRLQTKDDNGATIKTPTKKETVKPSLPLFIRRELKQVEYNRKQVVKHAEKLKKAAEREYRYAKKHVQTFERNEKKHTEMERRKVLKEEKRKAVIEAVNQSIYVLGMLPIVKDIEKRKGEIIKAKNNVDNQVSEFRRKKQKSERLVLDAKERFPQAIKECELSLSLLLLERSPPFENKCSTPDKLNKKRKGGCVERETKMNKINHICDNLPPLQSIGESTLSKTLQKKNNPKAHTRRCAGGIIPLEVSNSLNRKWLERDTAVAPSSLTQFVPQVGDTVLYYPSAHYNFLKEHPDYRSKKKDFILRNPLWQRAVAEREKHRKDYEKSNNLSNKQEKKKKNSDKIWWTSEWISSVQSHGRYPIICKVEEAVAEFPYNPKKKEKKNKKGKGNVSASLEKFRPSVGLNVTLKPLAPILPPKQIKIAPTGELFVEELIHYFPPLFSVFVFPSHVPQFLIPFTWTIRQSLSLSEGDNVKILFNDGSSKSGVVHSSEKEGGNIINDDTLSLFENIISHSCSEICNNNKNLFPKQETKLIVQAVLNEYYRKNIELDTNGKPKEFSKKTKSRIKNILDCNTSSLKLMFNWVRMILPRFNGVEVLWKNHNTECEVSTWNLTQIKFHRYQENRRYDSSARDLSLATFTIPTALHSGGFFHSLNENLRAQIEENLKKFIETNNTVLPFLRRVTVKQYPVYYCAVPISMTLSRILRRLKPQHIYIPKDFCQNTFTWEHHQQDPTKMKYCYYRSTASLLSDLSDVYHNCLLYNDPDSLIVNSAGRIARLLSETFMKLESDYLAKKGNDNNFTQILNSVKEPIGNEAEGQEYLEKREQTRSFKPSLLHTWVQHGLPDGSWKISNNGLSKSMWMPQCGDKIVYNRWLHHLFINGHCSCLTEKQKELPSTIPLNKDGKEIKMQMAHDVVACNQISSSSKKNKSNMHHNWIFGTVVWVRTESPTPTFNKSREESSTFDMNTSIYAIGVQFWQNPVVVIHWRPCNLGIFLNSNNEEPCTTTLSPFFKSSCFDINKLSLIQSNFGGKDISVRNPCVNSCKSCGISLNSSFVYPAWIKNNNPIVPPNPLSIGLVVDPDGIPKDVENIFNECFDILKERCMINLPVDSFDQKTLFAQFNYTMETNLLESHFYNSKSDKVMKTKEKVHLKALINNKIKKVTIRHSNNEAKDFGDICTQFDACLESRELVLCLALIQKRIQCGYYRSRVAIQHDICEAFVSRVSLLSENTQNSCRRLIAEALIRLNQIDDKSNRETKRYDSALDKNNLTEQTHKTNDKSGQLKIDMAGTEDVVTIMKKFNEKEIFLIKQVTRLRKLYATVYVCTSETHTAQIALGMKHDLFVFNQDPLELSNEQIIAREQVDSILSIVKCDPCLYRKTVSSILPTMKVKVRSKDNLHCNHKKLTHQSSVSHVISNMNENSTIIDRDKIKDDTVKLCYKDKYQRTNEVYQCLSRHEGVQLSPCTRLEETLSKEDNIKKTESNLSRLITFEPKDYQHNSHIIRALFRLKHVKAVCARCKLDKQSFLHCRIRRAHSNDDFLWLDYIKNIGGVNGLLKLLSTSYTSQPETALNLIQNKKEEHLLPIGSEALSNTKKDKEVQGDGNLTAISKDKEVKENYSANTILTSPAHQMLNGFTYNFVIENKVVYTCNFKEGSEDNINRSAFVVEDGALNPFDTLSKTEIALNLAQQHVQSSIAILKSQPYLSEEFIKASFLHDPTDDHHEVCMFCGLNGDVICCESCGYVSHTTCASLINIPEEDWHCISCITNKKCLRNHCEIVQQLEELLRELESLRMFSNGEDSIKMLTLSFNAKMKKHKKYNETAVTKLHTEEYNQQEGDGETVKNNVSEKLMTPLHSKRSSRALLQKDAPKIIIGKRKKGHPKKSSSPFMAISSATSVSLKMQKDERCNETAATKLNKNYQQEEDDAISKNVEFEQLMTPLHSKISNGAYLQKDTSTLITGKRKRGRPKKSLLPSMAISSVSFPIASGTFDKTLTYYCTLENDTCEIIAKKIKKDSWKDVAYIPENLERFGVTLKNRKTRFKKGSLVKT